MDWLKRTALRWLVRDKRFYDIMCVLRGPDISGDDSMSFKLLFTLRLRRMVGVQKSVQDVWSGPGIPEIPQFSTDFGNSGFLTHYLRHAQEALDALEEAGYNLDD